MHPPPSTVFVAKYIILQTIREIEKRYIFLLQEQDFINVCIVFLTRIAISYVVGCFTKVVWDRSIVEQIYFSRLLVSQLIYYIVLAALLLTSWGSKFSFRARDCTDACLLFTTRIAIFTWLGKAKVIWDRSIVRKIYSFF